MFRVVRAFFFKRIPHKRNAYELKIKEHAFVLTVPGVSQRPSYTTFKLSKILLTSWILVYIRVSSVFGLEFYLQGINGCFQS